MSRLGGTVFKTQHSTTTQCPKGAACLRTAQRENSVVNARQGKKDPRTGEQGPQPAGTSSPPPRSASSPALLGPAPPRWRNLYIFHPGSATPLPALRPPGVGRRCVGLRAPHGLWRSGGGGRRSGGVGAESPRSRGGGLRRRRSRWSWCHGRLGVLLPAVLQGRRDGTHPSEGDAGGAAGHAAHG